MALQLEFSGSPDIAAARETVWRRLVDPHFVAKSIPGVESMRMVGPDRLQIASAIGVGPVQLHLTGEIELFDLVEPERAGLRASATASGTTAEVVSAVRLEDAGPGRTVLHWTATAEIKGTLAVLGGSLLEGIARKLTTDFWTDFARRVEVER